MNLTSIGQSRQNRKLHLVTLGQQDGEGEDERPGFWLDGGTHSAEWTGIMACIYSLSKWMEAVRDGDQGLTDWLRTIPSTSCPACHPMDFPPCTTDNHFFVHVCAPLPLEEYEAV